MTMFSKIARFLFLVAVAVSLTACAAHPPRVGTDATSRDLDEDRILVTLQSGKPLGTAALSPSGRLGYHGASAEQVRAGFVRTAQQLARAYDLQLEEDWPIPSLQVHCFVFRAAGLEDRRRVVAQLRERADVESAQALQFFHGEASASTDPLAAWNAELDENLQAAHRNATGKSVSIAVIDAGIDIAHEDLEGSALNAIDLVDGRLVVPAEAHGTAVVGLIAARPENGIGIRGYAPASRVSLFRACWEPKTATETAVCNSFTLAKALSLVLESDADIVNLSISGPRDPLLERLAAKIVSRGQILVAAGTGTETFPGSVPGSVLATRLTEAHPTLTLLPGNRYGMRNGTSITSARLAGIAALILELAPGISSGELERLLLPREHSGTSVVLDVARLLNTSTAPDD